MGNNSSHHTFHSPTKPTNSLVTPLLTDLYQITMAYGYWKTNRHNDHAVFELFFRKNPFQGEYTVFAGIDECLKHLSDFRFTREDIEYLKSVPALQRCEPEFFYYLSILDCKTAGLTVKAMKPGTIVFPKEPLLVISGPLLLAQLLETTFLNLVNFPSLIATNASRMVIAARGQYGDKTIHGKVPKLAEFGLRRAQGPDGGFSASKYSILGGFDATANVIAGQLLNVPITGTHAHAFVMSYKSLDEVNRLTVKSLKTDQDVNLLEIVLKYRDINAWTHTNDGELAAFLAYGVAFPDGFLCLVDTYDTLQSGVKNFILVALALYECGYKARGIRLDSGDLASLSLSCREMFDQAAKKFSVDFLRHVDIVASNDLNEEVIHQLNKQGHSITLYGIGTNLVTCQAQPALGCVYKLVELNGIPRIKLSNDIVKVLIPGEKRVFRLFDEKGTPQMDLMMVHDEDVPPVGISVSYVNPFGNGKSDEIIPHEVQELLQVVWDRHGSVDIPSLDESRKNCLESIKKFPSNLFKVQKPNPYPVNVSLKLYDELQSLWQSSLQN